VCLRALTLLNGPIFGTPEGMIKTQAKDSLWVQEVELFFRLRIMNLWA
jgi:hypothetical protein